MLEALGAVALAALLLLALFLNGRAYRANAERRWPARGRFIEAEGARIHVVERGNNSGPPLLLIHGASANLLELLTPLAALEADHRLIAFDRPGYGYSSRPRNAQQLGVQAKLAARVLEETGAGRAVIVGHSLGGAVALRLALDRPDLVRGLVLVAPASHPYPYPNAWWARLTATPLIGPLFAHTLVPWMGPLMVKSAIATNFAPATPPSNYAEEAGVALAFRPSAFIANARDVCATKTEFAAQAPLYPDILAPVIIVTGDKDRIVNPKIHARALAVDLSVVEMVMTAGVGHMPHQIRTDLVISAVKRVESLAATPADS